jgi:hypothetical protein
MKNFTRILIAAAAVSATLVAPLRAQAPGGILPTPEDPPTRQGTRGANFLEIGMGARGNAMSGAVASLIDGPTAWYWNPAGVAGTESFSVAASRQNLYEDLDISMNYAGLALPFLGGVFGVSFTSLNSGDIQRTTTDEPFGDPVLGQTFEWTASAVGVGYARRLTDRLDVGLQLKRIREGLTDADISWTGLDLGTQFRTGLYGLTIGASLQNVGGSSRMHGALVKRQFDSDEIGNQRTRVAFATQDTELPTLFRFSVGTDLYGRVGSVLGQGDGRHVLLGDVNFSDAIDTDVQMALGLEYGFNNLAFVRAGKRFYNDDRESGSSTSYGMSGGLGLRLPLGGRALRFDYAYTALGDLENVQVFSFEIGR